MIWLERLALDLKKGNTREGLGVPCVWDAQCVDHRWWTAPKPLPELPSSMKADALIEVNTEYALF